MRSPVDCVGMLVGSLKMPFDLEKSTQFWFSLDMSERGGWLPVHHDGEMSFDG